MFMSITYLPIICLFVCPSVHSSYGPVCLSIYLTVSLNAVFLSQLLFLTPHKNVIKDRFFLDISMRVFFNKSYFNMKDYSLILVLLLWNCFIFNQNRNVTCEKKYEGLDRRGSAWKKIVSADVVPDIPLSNENELHKLNLRSNEFFMAQYYIP